MTNSPWELAIVIFLSSSFFFGIAHFIVRLFG
jgi:hypothetical protein